MVDLDAHVPRLSGAERLDSGITRLRALIESGKTPGVRQDPVRLKEVCRELESLFISHLLKEMRATVPKSGYLNGGRAAELYTSMLDGQLAKELSAKGGIGLVKLLLDGLEDKPAK